jgi:acetyltransferase-like isoleucine patch superfamily enzyme
VSSEVRQPVTGSRAAHYRYELKKLWWRLEARARCHKALSDLLPGRPTLDLGARVSWRAKLEGHPRNIRVRRGAHVREQAWLHCSDDDSTIEIGSRTLIMPYAKLVAGSGGRIKIGQNCTVHSFNVFYGFEGGLTIGDNVRIATGVSIIAGNHNFDDVTKGPNEQGGTSEGIVIENDVWIAAGVIIVDGVTIGAGAVIGAGSVVTKNVPANSVCVGVPAAVIRQRGEKRRQSQP